MKYTKLLKFKTRPALKDVNGYTHTSIKEKESIIYKSAFPKPSNNLRPDLITLFGVANFNITEDIVFKALMSRSPSKAQGSDKINFQILQMIWNWDKTRIISMVQHTIKLRYHSREWKRAKSILLEKSSKWDFRFVTLYQVITLLNCIAKIVEKVVTEQLFHYCKCYFKLHQKQMGDRN